MQRIRRHGVVRTAGGIVATAGVLAAVACGGPAPAAPLTTAADVPMRLERDGTRLVTDVEIGGAVLTVLVDTGSSGLRVSAAKVPPGAAEVAGPASPVTYHSGTRFTGRLARAAIGLGPVRSTSTPIGLVDSAGCTSGRPDCPAADFRTPGAAGGGYDGVLGISPAASRELPSPLPSFGPAGNVFAVHVDPGGPSTLTLGAPAQGYVLQKMGPMQSGDARDPARSPTWRATTPVCFESAALDPDGICGPTLMDTGTAALGVIDTFNVGDQHPAPGFPVDLASLDHRWSSTYPTAPGRSVDAIAGDSPAGVGQSIAGLPAFTRVDVRFDADAGTVGFRGH